MLRLWFDAARWCFNETIAYLKRTGEAANWKRIKTEIIHAVPDRLKPAPYQIKSVAIRDACKAVSAVRRYNRELRARGKRTDKDWAVAKFRSRKHPRQGCFIPGKAVSWQGIYYRMLGKLRMAERLPGNHGDSRLTLHNGQYYLSVSSPAQRRIGETQARVVALDPGIRTFQAFFSETSAGLIGNGAFGRIQRLCQHLDNLLSRAKLEKQRLRKRNLYRAAARLRVKIHNLIDELHHQTARWLVDRFDLILIPSFETQNMAKRGRRKIRAKSVRSMLTLAHFRFRQFLQWKAWQSGKAVSVVNEAYTSKTCSWSGEILPKLGGSRVKRGSDGVVVERDIDGARGTFLRALGDNPALGRLALGCIGSSRQLRLAFVSE